MILEKKLIEEAEKMIEIAIPDAPQSIILLGLVLLLIILLYSGRKV